MRTSEWSVAQFKQYGPQRHKYLQINSHKSLHTPLKSMRIRYHIVLRGSPVKLHIQNSIDKFNKGTAQNLIWTSGPRLDMYSTRVTSTWNQLIFCFLPHHNKMQPLHLHEASIPSTHMTDCRIYKTYSWWWITQRAAIDCIIHISMFENSMLYLATSNENGSKLIHL